MKYSEIADFLTSHADAIQKMATAEHKKFLGGQKFRTELIKKYQENHIVLILEVAKHLERKNSKKDTEIFKTLADKLAIDSVKEKLKIEEAVDGIAFLKQAIWNMIEEQGFLDTLTTQEFYHLSQIVGTYIDIVSSKIAFTYHNEFSKQLDAEKSKVKKAETELDEEKQYSKILDGPDVPVGVVILEGKSYTISFINPIICQLWDRTKKQALNKPLYDVLPELKGQGFEKLLKNVYTTGIPFLGNEVPAILHKKGKKETIYVNFVYNPIRDRNGKITGILVIATDVTYQVSAKKQVEESETKYKLISENSQDLIALLNLNGQIDYASPSHSRVLGFQMNELLYHTLFDVIHPNDKKFVTEIVKKIIKSKRNDQIEVRLQKKNGSWIWVEANISFLKRERSQVLLLSARDITIRKKREEEIDAYVFQLSEAKKEVEAEQKKLQELFVQAPAFITVMRGKNHIFDMANNMYYQLIGHRNIIGKPLLSALPEVKGQGFIELLDSVLKTGKEFVGQEMKVLLQRTPNAPIETRFVNFVYQPLKNSQRKVEGIFVHGVDVTDQVIARQKVEESEQRFRAVWESVSEGIAISNEEGVVQLANAAYFNLYGYSPKEVIGKNFAIIFPKEQRKQANEVYKKTFSGKINSSTDEHVIQRKDGSKLMVESSYDFIENNGKRIAMISTIRNITERKQLERQKDDFISIATHELKTPVTSIKAYAQVLQNIFLKKEDKRSAEYLGKMDAQLNKLTNLISDLLDVNKIQSGQLQFHMGYFDFKELVEEIVEELQRTTDKHTLVKKLSISKTVYGDRERIGQVLTNLISNAIKYSPHSDKIIITTHSHADSVSVHVEDFGVGIPEEKHDRVFEKFFRVSGPRQETFPGLGLGLFISSQIINRLGGKIWVESVAEKGSIFSFSLPIKAKRITQQKNSLAQEEMKHE